MKNKPTIWIFAIEPISTRYTQEWYDHLPNQLKLHIADSADVITVDGVQNNTETTPGAFLNFSDTNYWKSSQLCKFLEYYNNGEFSSNDQFLFTDAWNPIVLQLKYMQQLLGLNWKFHGLWHAGAYDPYDALGQKIMNEPWVNHTERAMFYAFDHNYFATNFHIELFGKNCLHLTRSSTTVINNFVESGKIVRTGWPMEYLVDALTPVQQLPKEQKIIFPHRISSEKQIDIFRDLAKHRPQYTWLVAQDQKLTKSEYHYHLSTSKLMFSASLQETLGISPIESALVGTYPLMPDRLSYSEMWPGLYPSSWTEDWESYLMHRDDILVKIDQLMTTNVDIANNIRAIAKEVMSKFFTGSVLYSTIMKSL